MALQVDGCGVYSSYSDGVGWFSEGVGRWRLLLSASTLMGGRGGWWPAGRQTSRPWVWWLLPLVRRPTVGQRLCCRWYAELPVGVSVDVDSFALNSADGDWGDVEDTAVDLTPAQRRTVAAWVAGQVTDHYADRVVRAVDAFAGARERLDSLLVRAVESGVPKTRAAEAAGITRQTLDARARRRRAGRAPDV